MKLGGHGVRRIERTKLEDYIAQLYEQTETWVGEHPFHEAQPLPDDDD